MKDKIKSIITIIKNLMRENDQVIEESIIKNIKRIRYFTSIQILIHSINIIYFIFFVNNIENTQIMWKQGIVILHATMLLVTIVIHLLLVRKHIKKNIKEMLLIQYVYFILISLGVVGIVAVDQLVTTNITPFIMTSLAAGILFYMRPRTIIILYTTIYISFYFIPIIMDVPANIATTNRINGFTVVLTGIAIALINWKNHYNDVIQKKEISKQKNQLENLAYYDPLTNLPNRRLLDIELKKEIEYIKRFNIESSIVILDIDHFKNINDTYGHTTGDAILKGLAELLSENVRKMDTIARLGGEEFIILFPKTSIEYAFVVAEKLRKLITNHEFVIDNKNIAIAASFGISTLNIDNENYYINADKALYNAKNNGRNQVQKYIGEI